MACVVDAWRPVRALDQPYVLSSSEYSFAREVLGTRTQMWLFRCHQQTFCGDFVVVDRSPARGRPVPCWVIELKMLTKLRLGRPGIQLANFAGAASAVGRMLGVSFCPPLPVIGSRADVLSLLG